jgi:quinol monooxygenase YgiN
VDGAFDSALSPLVPGWRPSNRPPAGKSEPEGPAGGSGRRNHQCERGVGHEVTQSFGAVLQMTTHPGQREEAMRILTNYASTLDGEPGTTLFAAAADPSDEDMIWVWEEFADGEAVRDHFQHDFFRALQLELTDLLAEPAAVRPLAPFVRRVNPNIAAG